VAFTCDRSTLKPQVVGLRPKGCVTYTNAAT
jgi:hypothetical protein